MEKAYQFNKTSKSIRTNRNLYKEKHDNNKNLLYNLKRNKLEIKINKLEEGLNVLKEELKNIRRQIFFKFSAKCWVHYLTQHNQ